VDARLGSAQRKFSRVCITVSENEPNKPGFIKEDKARIFRKMHEIRKAVIWE
jgi:hypothetical protein